MIRAPFTQKGCAREATPVLHFKRRWARLGTGTTPSKIDQRGSVLDRSELPGRYCSERPAGSIGVERGALHYDASDLSRRCENADVGLNAIRLAAGITPGVLQHLKVIAFYRGLSTAGLPRDVLGRELSHAKGEPS